MILQNPELLFFKYNFLLYTVSTPLPSQSLCETSLTWLLELLVPAKSQSAVTSQPGPRSQLASSRFPSPVAWKLKSMVCSKHTNLSTTYTYCYSTAFRTINKMLMLTSCPDGQPHNTPNGMVKVRNATFLWHNINCNINCRSMTNLFFLLLSQVKTRCSTCSSTLNLLPHLIMAAPLPAFALHVKCNMHIIFCWTRNS